MLCIFYIFYIQFMIYSIFYSSIDGGDEIDNGTTTERRSGSTVFLREDSCFQKN